MEDGFAMADAQTTRVRVRVEFTDIFETYHGRIFRYLDTLLHGSSLAEDLTQDTFVKVYEALTRGASPDNLNAWLYAIATNTALSALRRRRLLSWLPLGKGAHSDPVAPSRDLAERTADQDLLLRAFARLPQGDAACLLLRFQHDLTYEEVARVLNVSAPAAKMRVHRARAAFRAAYLSLKLEADR